MNQFLSTILPWIGAAVTGGVPALVGMAASTVGQVLGVSVGGSAKDIAAAVTGATPEQMLALRKADADFAVQMQAMGFQNEQELARVAAGDRASARDREKTLRDRTPSILAGVVTVGFFGVLSYLISHGVPLEGGEALLVMLGSLGTAWTGIIAYYFGSSAGSARKDVIAGMNK